MKLTKDYLKEVIKEELEKALEEQTSFAQAGKAAAEKRAKEMEGPGAVAQFLKKQGAAKAAPKDAFASVTAATTAATNFADQRAAAATKAQEPIDLGTQTIRARRPNRQVVQLQKALGVKRDGIIGPKTVAAYNARVKPDKPMTVQTLKSLMRKPNMIAGLIGGIPPGKAPASAVATGAGPKLDKMAPEYKQALEDLKDLEKLDLGLEEQFKRFL